MKANIAHSVSCFGNGNYFRKDVYCNMTSRGLPQKDSAARGKEYF